VNPGARGRPPKRLRLWGRLSAGLTEGAPLFPLVVLFGLNAVDELDRTAFNVLTPEIRRSFGLDISGVLGMVALIEVVAILLGLPLSYWADRRSRVRIATAGASLWGTCSVLTGLSPTVWLLAASRAGAGMGRAVVTPTHFSLLADYYPVDIRPKVFGTHRAANSVGQFVGPILAGLLGYWFGWRAPFLFFILPTAVFVMLALRLKEPTRGAHERRAVGADEAAAMTEEEPPGFGEGWRMLWGVRSLRRIWYSLPFAAAVIVGFGSLFAIFYEQEFGLNSAQRGLASAIAEPAQILGLVAGIPIANRLLRRDPALVLRFVALVGVIVAACFATLSITPYLSVVIFMNMLIAAAAAVLSPGVYSILSLAMPPRARSQGFAVSALWILPGLALFPIIGHLADTQGVRPALFVLSLPLLIAGFLLASAGKFVNADIERARTTARARSEALLARSRGEGKLLVVRDLDVAYDGVQVLFGVDFEVAEGEIVALLGTNGAGKSTLLRAISGVLEPTGGAVVFDGRDLTGMAPHKVTALGVAQVPGGRGVFPSLTVAENLRVAGWALTTSTKAELRAAMAAAAAHFPVLVERWNEPAGVLSGGEQQMLALAQAFVSRPRLLLIDELSLGLAPTVVARLLEVVREIRAQGTTVVLVEQSVSTALELADRAYFMEKGEIRFEGPAAGLLERPDLLRAVFLGSTPTRTESVSVRIPAAGPEPGAGAVVLEVDGLAKGFGAVRAVDGVSFSVPAGRILGIIGPNGAGKTTLFDLVSGFLAPDAGRVVLAGRDVTTLPADARARLGLGRSFQDARLFPSLTVFEALALALDRHVEVGDPVATALGLRAVARSEACVARRVSEIIELMGLGRYSDAFVSELSTGTRRLVDLGCALAHEPTVLLLDEPSSGIAQRESEALAPVLRDIRDATGAALLVVEHDMPLVTGVADELIALDLGRILARGLPSEVVADPAVVSAYLGAAQE
jgi:ABC-type branched-subunit amino acid transport system ATPase component/predicted MFS family arabinose efflux permease